MKKQTLQVLGTKLTERKTTRREIRKPFVSALAHWTREGQMDADNEWREGIGQQQFEFWVGLGWMVDEVASVRENDTLTAAGYFDVPRHDGGVA